MGAWYWIGVLAGLGVALGIAAAGDPPALAARASRSRRSRGAAIGFGVFGWDEAVAAAIGAAAGAFGTSPLVTGALRRGGTRCGLALFVLLGALIGAGLAFVPVAGYLEVVLLPVVGLRARRRAPEQHEGLRILARD